jgi:diadenosine tetraphosphate (Ap4A) HIT family hydrolase
MPTLIHDRVALARAGDNPYVISRLKSGWLVIGDTQPLPGYCLLLADPVVSSINDLTGTQRAQFLDDMARIGDALLKVTGAYRINYEILGNSEPALHAHITPRYLDEPDEKRGGPVMVTYGKEKARAFSPTADGDFVRRMRSELQK